MKRLLSFVMLASTCSSMAQDISGKWKGETYNRFSEPRVTVRYDRGTRIQEVSYGQNMARIELNLQQDGEQLTGTIKHTYLNEPGWLIHKISGTIKNGHVLLVEGDVVDYASLRRYYFATFEGNLVTDSTARTITIKGLVTDEYRKSYDIITHEPSVSYIPTLEFTVSRRIAVQPKKEQIKNIPQPVPVNIPAEKPAERKIEVVQTLGVVSDSLQLEFYDDGDIDGDTITVYYNKKMLINQQLLTGRPLVIKVPVIPGTDNEIVMFANNVGSIPPNTALLVFYDNGVRKEIRIDSDMKKSGTIIFRRK